MTRVTTSYRYDYDLTDLRVAFNSYEMTHEQIYWLMDKGLVWVTEGFYVSSSSIGYLLYQLRLMKVVEDTKVAPKEEKTIHNFNLFPLI